MLGAVLLLTAVAANEAPFPCAFDDCRTQTFYVIPAPNPVITATGGKVRQRSRSFSDLVCIVG